MHSIPRQVVDVVGGVRDNSRIPIEEDVCRVRDFTEQFVSNIFANAES